MNDERNPGRCIKALLNVRRQKVKGSNIQIARGNLNTVVWNKRSCESRTKRISVYRRRMAANGSRRRNHGWRKKHEWDRGKIKGQREDEMWTGGWMKGRTKRGRGWIRRSDRREDSITRHQQPGAYLVAIGFSLPKASPGFISNCTFDDPL